MRRATRILFSLEARSRKQEARISSQTHYPSLFWDLVILIQFLCLILGLVRTAKEGNRYWAQVGSGTLMSLIAGIILFFMVCLFTTVFPSYSEAMAALQRRALEGAGRTPEEIKFTMNIVAGTAIPWVQGLSALMATVVIGFGCSLCIAALVRKRDR
jgi:hypothetical protein